MMNGRRQHMQKAARFLRSVQSRATSDEPDTVISTAYYAMHHAACAVLLWRGDPLPKTHASLIVDLDSRFVILGRRDARPARHCMKLSFAGRGATTTLTCHLG